MRFNEIYGLKLDDYYWRLIFGKSKHRTGFFTLRSSGFKGLPAPVFFLSTGRCGTNWFTELLAADHALKAFHEPRPNFGVQGKIAYEVYTRSGFQPDPAQEQLLEEIFLTGREQHLRYSYKTQRRLVETNNQVTFLAPAIFSIFPGTKFVHLNRHPGEFVRSAMRRNFYNNTDDIKRIVPLEDDPYHKKWDHMSLLEKNSWLWTGTNAFIEKFKSTIPEKNHFYFDFNKLDVENIRHLCSFLGADIPEKTIRKKLGKPVNVQRSGSLADYSDWKDEEKESLRGICGDLAGRYHYQL